MLDDDLFDDGMVVGAADVVPHPDTMPPKIEIVGANYEDADTGLDPWGEVVAKTEGELEPGDMAVTPVEEYVREGNTVAPDGSPLSDNQIAKPYLWRAGDPRQPNSGRKKVKANRVNVREMVDKLAGESMLSPIEVMFYIMNANEESRHHLGLRKSDRISPNLRAKCAQELMTYMAPKLKSVEVKTDDSAGKRNGVQIFLPANTREQGEVAAQPKITLPVGEDGVQVDFSPEFARELILADDDEDMPDWDRGMGDEE